VGENSPFGADFVYFNHSIHISKGVGCSTCHGQINQMPLVFQANTLLMSWCLECHRNPERVLRPKDQVFNMDWTAPDNQAEIGAKLREEYKIRTTGRADELLDLPSLMDSMHEHAQYEHLDGQQEHHDAAGDPKLQERPMDLAAVRAQAPIENRQAVLAHARRVGRRSAVRGVAPSRIPAPGAFRMGRLCGPARFSSS